MTRKEYNVNGTICHCSITGRVLISEDGRTIADNHYGQPGEILTVQNDSTGPYIINSAGNRIDVGFAVAEAWLNQYPGDGPKRAKRLDGNVMNVSADNLKWEPDLDGYTQTTSLLRRVEWMGQSVSVCKNGKVMSGALELPLEDHYYVSECDCERYLYKPFVLLGKIQLPVDDLMAVAGYVGGSPVGMKCPKVLHKDFDMENYDSGNLEWTEFSSPRYQDYIEAMITINKMKSDITNAGKIVPDKFFLPPYCPKEYFNYKASGMTWGKKKA